MKLRSFARHLRSASAPSLATMAGMTAGALLVGASLIAGCAQTNHAGPSAAEPSAAEPTAAEPTAVEPTAVAGDELRTVISDVALNEASEQSPDTIAVDLKDNISDSEIRDLEAKFAITLTDNSPTQQDDGKVDLAHVDPAQRDALINALREDPRVEAVEPVSTLTASFVPNDPKYGDQWHMKRAGAEGAWEASCGRGVTVAVIDTGIACYDKGPFMKGSDLAGTRCVEGFNYVNDTKEATDDHGHGTHVAGTIAQTTNNGKGVAGLAFCANLMPIKVLSGSGSGTNTDVAEGIRFAADHGAQVINLSLGGPFPSAVIKNAVNHALAKGVVVVAAAGNSGKSVGYPAAYPGVIAVSATDKNDGIAWFSSRGPQVTIGAPGVGVTQQTICDGGKNKCEVFGVFNGTSMASPHVAGAAALLVAEGVTDADSVRDLLTATATPKEDKNLFGAGILNADKALQRANLTHLGLRVGLLVAFVALIAAAVRKKGGIFAASPLAGVGAVITAVGLLPFAPYAHLHTMAGELRPITELLARPLAEWDLALDISLHKWLVAATGLPVLALTLFGFGIKSIRPLIGGVAIGTAALAAQTAISGDVSFVFGTFMLRIVMLATIAMCFFVARLTLDKKA